MNLLNVERITHRVESILEMGRDGKDGLTANVYDTRYSALDMIDQWIAGLEVDPDSILTDLAG